jgi:hypothetical protein
VAQSLKTVYGDLHSDYSISLPDEHISHIMTNLNGIVDLYPMK